MLKHEWKSVSLALLLALGGGALINQHHSAHASTNTNPTVTRKTSEASMPRTKAFFNHLNQTHPYGMNVNTQAEAKAIRNENRQVNQQNTHPQHKVDMQIGHPVSATFPQSDNNISNYRTQSIESQNNAQFNYSAPTSIKSQLKVSQLKQKPQQFQAQIQSNKLSNQKFNTYNNQYNQQAPRHNMLNTEHQVTQSSSNQPRSLSNDADTSLSIDYQDDKYVRVPVNHSDASQSQSMSNDNNTSLSIDYKDDKYVRVPVTHKSKNLNSILKVVTEDINKQNNSYKASHNGSALPGTTSSVSTPASEYPHTYENTIDYQNDTYTKVPVYKTAQNKNYDFDEGADDNTNFYQTGFSESKPDNYIRYAEGNHKMNFGNPVYLQYKKHVNAKHHGDPQSVSILPGNRALVLFNVNHGDSERNKNNYDRILEYHANSGKYLRKGQAFLGAHGQGLAYDPANNALWLINNRSSYTESPAWIRISQATLKPTGKIMKVETPGVFGNDLAFDNNGNAYNVVKVTKNNNTIHAPVNSLAMTVGHKVGNKYVFHYVQGLRYSPGHIIQNLTYNPNNGRMYIICNSSIVSFPTNKVNHLTGKDIQTTKFNHHFEMEDLGFTKNQTYLLMNWPARLLRESK